MNPNNRNLFLSVAISFLVTGCSVSEKEKKDETKQKAPVSIELYNEIAHMDSVLFNAFNSRDTAVLKNIFTTDLEFYHDKSGLENYTETMEAFKNTMAQNNDLNRELIEGSLEVFPINNYGAIETGLHKFCHTENGKQDCGTFKFLHIWKKINNEWKISRVVSYDH